MKWLVGILLILNLFIFVMANIGDNDYKAGEVSSKIPENVANINLLTSGSSQLPGNCANVGPIEQKIVLTRFEQVIAEQTLPYRVISEAGRKSSAYRVLIPIDNGDDLSSIKQRLLAAGVEEFYEKKRDSGESVLSLGVFTYKKTAVDLANNLTNTGFAAKSEREFIEYPQRYWLNLDKPLEQSVLLELNKYLGSNKLAQNSAKCH